MEYRENFPDLEFLRADLRNTASDGSHVGVQAGVNLGAIYGANTVHDARTYHINEGDPPERRHEVAVNHLHSDTPRPAEKILRELLDNGHRTSARYYYYVLSILSGRSTYELDGERMTEIHNACKRSDSLPADRWRDALQVVRRFLLYGCSDVSRRADGTGLDEAMRALGALSREQQEEIRRHLALILSGDARERLEADQKNRAATERLQVDRAGRAWKFFEPDPLPPKVYLPQMLRVPPSDWIRAVAGGLAVLAGMLLLDASGRPGTVLGIPMLIGSGYLLLRYGADVGTVRIGTADESREALRSGADPDPRSPGHWVTNKWVEELYGLVDIRFRRARPHIAGRWPVYTRQIRASLKLRLRDQYGNSQRPPGCVDWLIRWHAKRAADAWAPGEQDLADTAVSDRHVRLLFRLGIVVAAAGLVGLLSARQIPTVLLVAGGGWHLVSAIAIVVAVRRTNTRLEAEAADLYAAELRAYEEWVEKLADRPTDTEMARWLMLDKVYLRSDALRRAGVSSRDVVAHVVMTEAATGARSAAEKDGPRRYTAYVVHLFLLTHSGVRESKVDLDFLDGTVRNERRTLFRYDTLASANVIETGVRTARDDGGLPRDVERLRSRKFSLTLVDGKQITQVTENFRVRSDETSPEDEADFSEVLLRTSGIESALRVLESVAAEGSDWIGRDQERRARWSQDWLGWESAAWDRA